MNPLTNIKNQTKLNERELELGIAGDQGKSWHGKYADSAWLYVGGLPYDLTEGDVICVFSQYGEVVNINLVRDRKTGKSRGFCFVCYEDQRSTVLAVDNLNGIKLVGRVLRVDHVEEYRVPKEHDDIDEDTKRIWRDGCAPKPISLPAAATVEDDALLDLPAAAGNVEKTKLSSKAKKGDTDAADKAERKRKKKMKKEKREKESAEKAERRERRRLAKRPIKQEDEEEEEAEMPLLAYEEPFKKPKKQGPVEPQLPAASSSFFNDSAPPEPMPEPIFNEYITNRLQALYARNNPADWREIQILKREREREKEKLADQLGPEKKRDDLHAFIPGRHQ